MTVGYLDLAYYVGIAAEVTGFGPATVLKVANLNLADSALHAPAAGFDGTDFYPDFVDKAAVLAVRLAKNHPLPDGNKRVAWVALRYFLMLNEHRKTTQHSFVRPASQHIGPGHRGASTDQGGATPSEAGRS